MNSARSAARSMLLLCALAAPVGCAYSQPTAPLLNASQETGAARAAVELSAAAQALVASLEEPAQARLCLPMDEEERFNWHFVPRQRRGLPLKDMSQDQHRLVHALLAAGLSERGHLDARQILELESVLRQLERRDSRDVGLYYVTIFGAPAADGTWGWRFEGHHLSLNFTIVKGRFVAAAPAFFGANPAAYEGRRVLGPEETLGRELVSMLPEEQRRVAVIAERAFPDILTGASRTIEIGEPQGLAFSRMGDAHQRQLRELVAHYAHRLREELAAEDLARIEAAGWDKVHFAWAGSTEPGEGHYYRIHGPTFLIEYDNTQDRANHVHTVWRDLKNDFGRDMLREHYEAHRQNAEHGHSDQD